MLIALAITSDVAIVFISHLGGIWMLSTEYVFVVGVCSGTVIPGCESVRLLSGMLMLH